MPASYWYLPTTATKGSVSQPPSQISKTVLSAMHDGGAEFTARAVREWLGRAGAWTLNIEPGTPWENGYTGSFNGKLSDELLREIPASSGARSTGSPPLRDNYVNGQSENHKETRRNQ